MKKRVLFAIIFFWCSCVFGYPTNASRFAEQEYAKSHKCQKVCINVKKEYTQIYGQKFGEQTIPAITYGYGDMTIRGCKKCRITYIVLLDCDCKPVWSAIVKGEQ